MTMKRKSKTAGVGRNNSRRGMMDNIVECNGFTIIKVAKDCWRIINPGYGNDFMYLRDARYFCENGGSLYPVREHAEAERERKLA